MDAGKQNELDLALLTAADEGDLPRVKELIAAGADLGYGDGEALALAAMSGHLALVTYLVESCRVDPVGREGGRSRWPSWKAPCRSSDIWWNSEAYRCFARFRRTTCFCLPPARASCRSPNI